MCARHPANLLLSNQPACCLTPSNKKSIHLPRCHLCQVPQYKRGAHRHHPSAKSFVAPAKHERVASLAGMLSPGASKISLPSTSAFILFRTQNSQPSMCVRLHASESISCIHALLANHILSPYLQAHLFTRKGKGILHDESVATWHRPACRIDQRDDGKPRHDVACDSYRNHENITPKP